MLSLALITRGSDNVSVHAVFAAEMKFSDVFSDAFA
jgi:hypothetical protein